VKLMIKLHSTTDADMLGGHRQRFNSEYIVLKHFFKYSNSYGFIKSLLKIPLLPESPPNFLDTGAISSLPSIKVTENEEAETKQDEEWNNDTHLVDITAQEVLPEVSDQILESKFNTLFGAAPQEEANGAATAAASSNPFNEQSIAQHEYMLEIEMLKSEIQRLQNEHTSRQQLLLDRIRTLEEEIKVIVQIKSQQDDEMSNLSAVLANKGAAAVATDDKYNKVRDAYTKLREEHVDTLRKLGALQNSSASNSPAADAQIAELQQRLTALQVDQVALQEGRRTAEAESTETKVALQAAESRASRAEVHATEGVKQASVELLERMLKAVCSRAVIDNNTIGALLQEQEFVQCRSCAEVVSNYVQRSTAEVQQLKTFLNSNVSTPLTTEALILNASQLSVYLAGVIVHAKAVSNSAASIEKSDELSVLCKNSLEDSVGIFSNISASMDEWRRSAVAGHVTRLEGSLSMILRLVEECRPQIKDVKAEDLASALEMEMQQTMELVANAEKRFKELLQHSKTSMTGIQLEVHSQILDSCTELMSAIALLVAKARELQNEIVESDRGSATVKEFYKRHSRWTEGLFSAAKSVGAGANFLVSTADAIMTGNGGKLEQMVVAALEISSCTTQLLVASRVKAITGSPSLRNLESAARDVSKMTGKVVAGANSASTICQQSENMEFAQLSFTQARKAEVDSQVRVLELEASLAAERKRLAEIRRFNYSNSAEVEMKS